MRQPLIMQRRTFAWPGRPGRSYSHRYSSLAAIVAAFGITSVCAFAPACSGEPRPAAPYVVDTVAGVVHVRNQRQGAWRPGEAWSVGEPALRIGVVDGADEYVFGDVAGVALAADGRVYVADGQAREIRVFAPDGRFLFRFGRGGEGPGEFGAIDAIVLTPEGGLLARDPRLFRITRFAADGSYISDFRLLRPYMQFGRGPLFWVDAQGDVYDRVSLSLGMQSSDSLGIVHYTPDGNLRTTTVVAETQRQQVLLMANGVIRAGLPVPFSAVPAVTVGPDGRIARTLGQTFAFDILDADGRITRTVERDVPQQPVGAADRDSALVQLRERAKQVEPEAQLQEFTMPGTRPAVSTIVADDAGFWWLGERAATAFLADPAVYHVFDAEGIYLGAVAVGFRILHIGRDRVAGVLEDSLGASHVVIAPLTRPRA
jgi:hypothetical protein